MDIEFLLATSQATREMKQEAIRLGLAQSRLSSTGSYSLDKNLNTAPEKTMILILGSTGSGKSIVANAIKKCFKNCILLDGPEDQKQNVRKMLDDCDCVIITHQTRRRGHDEFDFGCSMRIAYSADYIFSLEKVKSGIIKVVCVKNRHRPHGDKFYLDIMLNKGQVTIEEL